VVKVAEMGRYVITNLHVGLLLNEEKPKTIKTGFYRQPTKKE
jgi:hypothetical protein